MKICKCYEHPIPGMSGLMNMEKTEISISEEELSIFNIKSAEQLKEFIDKVLYKD